MKTMAKRGLFSRTGRATLSFALPALALLLGAGASGCYLDGTGPRREVVVETTTPTPSLSTLVVRWTISGTRNPDECVKANATEIEVSVADPSGREIGAWRQRCEAFALSITLNPGRYDASAFLLAADGRIRTTTVRMDPFTLRGNDTLEIPVDFPASSFHQQ
jgi:hypothetical protein